MAHFKPKLTAVELKPPGLIELLFKKTYEITIWSTFLHVGMFVTLITGITIECLYLTGFSYLLGGYSWVVMWTHGFFGLFAIIGFIGILVRIFTKPYLKPTSGRLFYLESTLVVIVGLTGVVLLARMLNIIPVLWGWETTLHIVSVTAWLVVSSFKGGLIHHAIFSTIYPYADPLSQTAYKAFHPVAELNQIQLSAHETESTTAHFSPLPAPLTAAMNGDAEYWTRMVMCQDACPVHTDVCGYVTAIAEGRYEEAYKSIRANNPFASICGRVCSAPCEDNCRRGYVDAPVAIRALKRFVVEQYGPETGDDRLYHEGCDERMLPPDRGDYEKVAVVGSGVAGLTAAHDLTKVGYKVTVFEAESEPGGILTTGVPVFRLPREPVKHEIQAILNLGVELKCNQRLGRDFSLQDLRNQVFKAIFPGTGLAKHRKLAIAGSDLPQVHDGLEFLRRFNRGEAPTLGPRVAIIGGGNVAMDCARAALRSGSKSTIVYRRSRVEMPGRLEEIRHTEEEGVDINFLINPTRILGEGKVVGMGCLRMELGEPDASGRRRPVPIEGTEFTLDVDAVILAIGQTSDLSFLRPEDNVKSEWELIKVDPETNQTSAPDVFAGGDVSYGPKLFIDAIASGQVAARSIHDYLRGTKTEVVVRKRWLPASYEIVDGVENLDYQAPHLISDERRTTTLDECEELYTEMEAQLEGSRCLRCNVNTVFDAKTCVACLGCVEVCPEGIITPVGLGQLTMDETWQQRASQSFRVPLEVLKTMEGKQLDSLGAVMMKDDTTCTRCAACAIRCPTLAVSMREFELKSKCVSTRKANPKLTYSSPS